MVETVCIGLVDGPGVAFLRSGAAEVVSGGLSGGTGCEVSLRDAIGGGSSPCRFSVGSLETFALDAGGGGSSFWCMAAMAAFRSIGHTEA